MVHADEHSACSDLDDEYQSHTPEELRFIAASCNSKPVANLYYNRAYHTDPVSEARIYARLIAYTDNSSNIRLEANRIYMALLEQMAPIWYQDSSTRVAFLNKEYDRHVEIATLRLQGYDRIADRLERNIITHQ